MPNRFPKLSARTRAAGLALGLTAPLVATAAPAMAAPLRFDEGALWDRVGAMSIYSYRGAVMDEVIDLDPDDGIAPPEPFAYGGIMQVDEGLLPDGTLVEAEVVAGTDTPGGVTLERPPWMAAFTVFPFPATSGAALRFATDAERSIVRWQGDFLDGPPDGRIDWLAGDSFYAIDYAFVTDEAGTWTLERRIPAPIPLPAAVWFFGAALAALFGIRLAGPGALGPGALGRGQGRLQGRLQGQGRGRTKPTT